MARGRPSRDRQTASTVVAVSSSRANCRRMLAARSANSVTESGNGNGSSAWTASPSMPSGAWLVARIRSGAAPSSSRVARSATPSSTCSQLSRTSTVSAAATRSSRVCSPPVSCSASVTSRQIDVAGSATSSLTSQTPPPGRRGRTASRAVRVLPTPAGPTRVTSRLPSSSRPTAARSSARPTNGVDRAGRLPTARAGAAVPRAPAAASRPLLCWRTCRSRSRSDLPGSMPSSSMSSRRTRRQAASASACRPARYRAVISEAQRPSRSGCWPSSHSSSAIASPPAPRSTRAATRSSSRPSRTSSRRDRWGWSHSPSPASARTSPRNSSSASVAASSAAAASPARRAAAAHLAHDEDLLDALVRDHLADHPDSILAAWIATQHQRPA